MGFALSPEQGFRFQSHDTKESSHPAFFAKKSKVLKNNDKKRRVFVVYRVKGSERAHERQGLGAGWTAPAQIEKPERENEEIILLKFPSDR